MTAAAALLTAAALSWGAEPSVELAAPKSPPLGAVLTVTAKARIQAQETISLDLERSATDSFAITAVRELPAAMATERLFQIDCVPLDVGRQTFPLFWTLSDGVSTRTAASQFQVEVAEPPDAAKARDVKDIKPPRPARARWWPYALPAAALLALWYWHRRRRLMRRQEAAASGPPPDPRPPEVIAEEEFSRLESSGLWAEGRHKEFYVALTETVRHYLERRFPVPASKLTTTELHRRLRQLEVDRAMVALFKDLFDRADLVKFAKTPARPSWGADDLASARRLVRETTPSVPISAPVGAVPSGGRKPS